MPQPTRNAQLDLLGLAEQFAKNPPPFVDDRVGPDGAFVGDVAPPTLVRERAIAIYDAALNAGLADAVDAAAEHRAEADGLNAEIHDLTDVHASIRVRLAKAEEGIDAIRAVPNHVRPAAAKVISLLAKPILLAGDTMLLGKSFYAQGDRLEMAVLAGLSIASSAVLAGSLTGRKIEQENQRRDRGPAPAGTRLHVDLFAREHTEGGSGGAGRWFWLGIATVVAFVLATAVRMFAVGTGASPMEALGLGLLSACTVIGSAAADAYGTNPAADQLGSYEKEAAACRGELEEAARLVRARDAADSTATSLHQAGIARAHSSAIAAGTIANTEVNEPRIYGYLSSRTAQELTRATPEAPACDLTDRPLSSESPSGRFGNDALHQYICGSEHPTSEITRTDGPETKDTDTDVIDLPVPNPSGSSTQQEAAS